MKTGSPETNLPFSETSFKHHKLAQGVYYLEGAVNTGVLIRDGKALLIDCCDSVSPQRLAELGVHSVEWILCTQYRRSNTAGAYAFVDQGAQLAAPQSERTLFEKAEEYWADPKNRWHLYHSHPGPEMLTRPLPVARAVHEGDAIEWNGFTLRVLDTPGATCGSVSYLLASSEGNICFSGDVLYGPGQVWELYSLQKGFGEICDYHGFLGNRPALIASLHKVAASGARLLLPSHGAPIQSPQSATALLEERLNALWRNYTATSALNFYFPHLLDETKDDPRRLSPAHTTDPPVWIRRVAATSFAVISNTGAALLIDCGNASVIDTLDKWKRDNTIRSVEGCWITHYHDDHVDALPELTKRLGCPIMTDQHLSEIIEHPDRFILPCISPAAAPVAKVTHNGERWTWREFSLTAFHFPGQTLYHSGLLVEGHGEKAFFAGDSGAPTGLDDYTSGNRVFLGEDAGSRKCLEIWRACQPGYIFNEHQDKAFTFSNEQLDTMDGMLVEREQLVSEMTPWDNPNFALDPWWVRTYPYDQNTHAGVQCWIDVQFTNHGPRDCDAAVEPIVPHGWTWLPEKSSWKITVPPQTDGWTGPSTKHPDGAARIVITIPANAVSGSYTIPFRIRWNARYLGQFRHARIVVQ